MSITLRIRFIVELTVENLTQTLLSIDRALDIHRVSLNRPLSLSFFRWNTMNIMVKKINRPKAVICDIEGTTTSTRYWGECLVPFIKYNAQKCLRERWDIPIVMELIDALRKSTEEANKEGAGRESLVLLCFG